MKVKDMKIKAMHCKRPITVERAMKNILQKYKGGVINSAWNGSLF